MMKFKFNLFTIFTLLFIVSCSSDNDSDTNTAEAVQGNHKGYTVADFQYTEIPMITPNENIVITANADGTCNVSFTSEQWGVFTISKAQVVAKGDKYTISGSGKTVMGMSEKSKKEYDCDIEGVVSKDKKNITFVFDVPKVMGGLKITFNIGDAPAGSVIAGTYKGYTEASFKYINTPMVTPDETVVVITNEDGTSNISFTSAKWGTFTISNAQITSKDKVYTVKGGGKTIMGMSEDSKKEYNCTVEGTIASDKKTVTFLFEVPAVMGGLKITFNLGNVPAADNKDIKSI